MRIIGGDAKGRKIFFPRRYLVRPTSDKNKETLFNILSSVQNNIFLDIYAGSGSIGIEALSRGASFAVFIEKDTVLTDYIKKNLQQCGFSGKYLILNLDAKKALSLLKRKNRRFDVIFADPPYYKDFVGSTLSHVADGKLFTEDGLLIVQHSVREKLPKEKMHSFFMVDQRKIGDTLLSILKCQEI